MEESKFKNLFEVLGSKGIQISEQQKSAMIAHFESIKNYEPRIGIFGKTGVGKSSLCNAIFGEPICAVSDVMACTREAQDVVLNLMNSDKKMKLIDVPGAGESHDRNIEYAELYAKLLPELDVVLWLLKADDRAYSSDEEFYKKLIVPHLDQGKPVFFVLNQVDKVMPFREWNIDTHEPGPNQLLNIDRKRQDVAGFFGVPVSKVIAVSAEENYNLINLVDEIIFALPFEKQITAIDSIKQEYVSDDAVNDVKHHYEETFGDKVNETMFEVVDTIGNIGESILDGIENVGTAIFDTAMDVLDGCYITTAVCLNSGKADDCYELTQLRWFRDNWLKQQPDGEELIEKYYNTAPKIVAIIDQQPDKQEIYDSLKMEYIDPCLRYIENKEFLLCKEKYIDMVVSLCKKYIG